MNDYCPKPDKPIPIVLDGTERWIVDNGFSLKEYKEWLAQYDTVEIFYPIKGGRIYMLKRKMRNLLLRFVNAIISWLKCKYRRGGKR